MLNVHNYYEGSMQKNGRKITMEELRENGTVVRCKDCGKEIDSHWLRNGPNDYPLMNKCALDYWHQR